MTMSRIPTPFAAEDGAMSVVNLFFILAVGMLSGVAIDVSNLMSARTQLQTAADAAAHAALVEREWLDMDASRATAMQVLQANMPASVYGEVLDEEAIQFGAYDRATKTFTPDEDSRNAVMVETSRLSSNGNPVGTFLLHLVGVNHWDVKRQSVFETFFPTCLREGFVAQGVVDIQSNNSYFNGFCIHSNSHVAINQNNFFEAGTIVSMPDTADLVVPNNGLEEEKNEGLVNALREGRWFIKILNRLDRIVAGVQDKQSEYAQSYITSYTPVTLIATTVNPGDFTSGRIYKSSCTNKLTFNSGVYKNIVVIANCDMVFKNGAEFQDAVIITKSNAAKAMTAPNNLVLGAKDNCAEGGGAILVSYGGVEVASSLEMHGSQIIAAGNVQFTANADGIRGASIVAGGRIDGTSNMNFAFCGSGMAHIFKAKYFRLAG